MANGDGFRDAPPPKPVRIEPTKPPPVKELSAPPRPGPVREYAPQALGGRPEDSRQVEPPEHERAERSDAPEREFVQDRPRPQELDVVLVFPSRDYASQAKQFYRQVHPEYRVLEVRDGEDAMITLASELDKAGADAHLRDLAVASHGAEGVILFPLTGDQPQRMFTAPDVADLQGEMRSGKYKEFSAARERVVSAIDDTTTVVVRACRVGRSQETLDALRVFLGGRPTVLAPKGYQVWWPMEVGSHPLVPTTAAAYDFLEEQGVPLEGESPSSAADRAKVIEEKFGQHPRIMSEAFIRTEADASRFTLLRAQLKKEDRQPTAAEWQELETLLVRPSETDHGALSPGVPDPWLSEDWGSSAPNRERPDPEMEKLSVQEIYREAQHLNGPYRPENASRLLRLMRAWDSRPLQDKFDAGLISSDDPLAGMESPWIFGDPAQLAQDAARFPEARPRYDEFKEGSLPRRELSKEERAEQARQLAISRELATTVPKRRAEGLGRGRSERGRIGKRAEGMRAQREASDIARPKDGVGFAEGESTVLSSEMQRLRSSVPDAVWNDPNTVATIEASASRSGSFDGNQQLSEQRAEALAGDMRAKGFQGQIVQIARGEIPARAQGKPPGVDDPADRVAIVTFEAGTSERPDDKASQGGDPVEKFAEHLPTREDVEAGGRVIDSNVLPDAHNGGRAYAKVEPSLLSEILKGAEIGEKIYMGAEMAGWLEGLGVAGGIAGGVVLPALGLISALVEIGEANGKMDIAQRRTAYYEDYTSGFAAGISAAVFGRSSGLPPRNLVRHAVWENAYKRAQSLNPVQQRQVVANLAYINTEDHGDSFQQRERQDLQSYRSYLRTGGRPGKGAEAMLQNSLYYRLQKHEYLWR